MKTSTKYLKIFVNFLLFAGAVILCCYVIPKALLFFMPFLIGWIISLIANPLVRFLESKVKILRKHSSVLIVVGVLALIIGGIYFASAKLIQEASNFTVNLPEFYSSLERDLNEVGRNLQGLYNRLPDGVQVAIDDQIDNLSAYAGNLVTTIGKPTFTAAGNFAKNLPSILVSIIMTILSAYFFIADREKIYGFLKKNTPEFIRSKTSFAMQKFKQIVGGYFIAQFKIMIVVTIVIFISLLILRVDYLFILTVVIAFFDFLPVFGAGTVLLPWALFKILTGDYQLALGLLVVYGITQLVRQIIQPKLVGDSIGMDPFVTLICLFIGYKFGGVMGMIIAIPAGMILIILYQGGVFDNLFRYIKMMAHDINEFRKIDE